MRTLLNSTFGGENVFQSASSSDAIDMPLNESLQPVLVMNSLKDSPFDQIDQRITTEVYNPFDMSGAEVPLKVQEVNPPPITIETPLRQFVEVQGSKNVTVFTAVGARAVGPYTTPLWTYNAGYNLLPWGIIRSARIALVSAGNVDPYTTIPGNPAFDILLQLTHSNPPFLARGQAPPISYIDTLALYGKSPYNPDIPPARFAEPRNELWYPIPLINNSLVSPPTLTIRGLTDTDVVARSTFDVVFSVIIEIWSTGGSSLAPYLRNNAQYYPFEDGLPVTALRTWS